ncbi:MAG: transcription-repair coupling factor [Marinilabiliales bacterium]
MQKSDNNLPKLFIDNAKDVYSQIINVNIANFKSLKGSSISFLLSNFLLFSKKPILIIFPDKEDAAYCYNDLQKICGNDKVLFYPSSYKRYVDEEQIDNSNVVLRTEVISKLYSARKSFFIISYAEAIAEKILPKNILSDSTLTINTGEKVSQDFVVEVLDEYGFNRVDFVTQPGEFAVRGSIIDVFSFADELPYRIDYFDDEIESLRSFDVSTQTSIETFKKITIIPDINKVSTADNLISLFDLGGYFSEIIIQNTSFCIAQIEKYWEHSKNVTNSNLSTILITNNEFINSLQKHRVVEIGEQAYFNSEVKIDFEISHQPVFRKNFNLLTEHLIEKQEQGFQIYISSQSQEQIDRLTYIFKDKGFKIDFKPVLCGISKGFIDNKNKICFYTDHQIFERYYRYTIKEKFKSNYNVLLDEINKLNPGDFVVHVDQGIGIFGGLEKIEVNGKIQEAIKLIYKDNDILYVNIHSLHRISKYKSASEEKPRIYKLGTGAWQKLKQSTKSKVKDIARDLIKLYAQRMQQKGHAFPPDNYMNKELEASFFFEDTPDQVKATKMVKEFMEKDTPMDLLVCGDVGFGKTEIAVRAAFKAVCDSKQVAVLVPTTILALQHYRTFKERLDGFPCTVEYISRLRSGKTNNEVKRKLKEGLVDIVIGTHILVGKNVEFKDLGLLIIDEEQKFGVAIKEKLKQIKVNVDTLTLSATPIPRTLQFSLMGARDLCILNTPPPNRHPIITELHLFNETTIKRAIEYEIERQGQVYFINNRIKGIYEIEKYINKICPNVKTAVVHGQMDGKDIERIMTEFIDGKYGVLIATSIIENGVDIPNVNTIIINDAHHFGLSDLHQLRGRVGRSNKKAFCYLLAPPLMHVTPDARKRLKTIVEYSELGSGFNISLQDLDIRGAGNLLGAEQSGFIADIGFETYQRILYEAMQELKESEFKDLLLKGEKQLSDVQELKFVLDCVIDTDMELLFPENYVPNISERIKLYKQLDSLHGDDELAEFENMLKDRFGEIPDKTKELIEVVKLRRIAISMGIEKIILKQDTMICHFVSQKDSYFYQSKVFSGILNYLLNHKESGKLKEQNDKLSLIFDKVKSIRQAIKNLKKIHDELYFSQVH